MLGIIIAKVMCLKWTLIDADVALVGGAALYGICRRGRRGQWGFGIALLSYITYITIKTT